MALDHFTPRGCIHSCPWPECMVLKCTNPPRTVSDGTIRRKAANLTGKAIDNLLTAQAIEGFVAGAPNKTKLRLRIQRNFALITAMIKAHPCLKQDFRFCATMVTCST